MVELRLDSIVSATYCFFIFSNFFLSSYFANKKLICGSRCFLDHINLIQCGYWESFIQNCTTNFLFSHSQNRRENSRHTQHQKRLQTIPQQISSHSVQALLLSDDHNCTEAWTRHRYAMSIQVRSTIWLYIVMSSF